MSDPLSGGAGKVAEEMLKEVQQAMQQADQLAQADGVAPTQSFENVMNVQQAQQVQGAQEINGTRSTTEVLRTATAQQRGAPDVPAISTSLDSSPIKSGLHRILEDIMQGQNKYGKVLDLAMSGRQFSHSELLALQAGVYRFSQELELTSKVIEKGTSAIKQTLNTQV